jgi:hypothetical protein
MKALAKQVGQICQGLTLDDSIEKHMIRETIKAHHAEPTWVGATYKKANLAPGMY